MNIIDIKPSAASIRVYQNMAYTHWGALGEFVDNSVQSFLNNKRALRKHQKKEKLKVEINTSTRDGGKVTIKDNAAGIGDEDMIRAFEIGTPPEDTTGNNEFGMGMKVAACWYAKNWTVETKSSRENFFKRVSVDVRKISKTNDASIEIEKFTKKNNTSYTIITLENLNKFPTAGPTTDKIKKYLSSMYRNYLRRGTVDIIFNGEKLYFDDITYLNDAREEDKLKPNPKKYDWKKNIDINFRKYRFYGFAGIREKGSTSDAGFHLFRRGRMIETTVDTYRPKEIFGLSNSFEYQRIYGEIHVDDKIEVDFTKTKLLWDDEIQNGFKVNLKEAMTTNPLDLIYKAQNHRSSKSRLKNFDKKNELGLKNAANRIRKAATSVSEVSTKDQKSSKIIKIDKKLDVSFENTVNIAGEKWNVQVVSSKDTTISDWLSVNLDEKNKKVQIIISVDHAFSSNYFPDTEKELEGIYLIAQNLVIAEINSRILRNESHTFIRRALNKLLLNISKIE